MKDYVVKISNGYMTVSLLGKGLDGRKHSAMCPYPDYSHEFNEETRQVEIKKLTRKQCIEILLKQCRANARKVD